MIELLIPRQAYHLLFLIIAGTLSLTSSCTVMKTYSTASALPISFSPPPAYEQERLEFVTSFEIRFTSVFDYTRTFNLYEYLWRSEDFQEILRTTQIPQECAAIYGLHIKIQYDLGDYCLNAVTLGLAYAVTIVIQGDLYRRRDCPRTTP